MKTRFRLIGIGLLMSLTLAQPSATEQEIGHSLPPVAIELGQKITFHSANLDERRSFYIRLPDDYQQTTRHYPIIYLLDANNETLTYVDNLYFHSLADITRLIKQGDIPDSIVVGIPFSKDQWFNNVIADSKPFEDYLTQELSPYITKHYRTLKNTLLIGQSYSAVFVINTLANDNNAFNSYVAIDPILGGGELERSIEHYQEIPTISKRLQIMVSDGEIIQQEAKALFQQIARSPEDNKNISFDIFPTESHQSIYYPALNYALRGHFKSYRKPHKELMSSPDFNYQSLLSYFEKRSEKYRIETPNELIQSAIHDVIFHQLIARQFSQAFKLWPFWKSPHKMYHVNRLINLFTRANDLPAAITFLQHLTRIMPDSVILLDRMATLYERNQELDNSREYRLKVEKHLEKVFSTPLSADNERQLNSYGYHLVNVHRNKEAIGIFKRITQAAPKSVNAYDSLAEAYEVTGDYPQAIKTLEKTLVLALSQENANITFFERKLSRLKKQLNTNNLPRIKR